VLAGLDSGSIALDGINAAECFGLLLQNTQEGIFADPVYGGNRDMGRMEADRVSGRAIRLSGWGRARHNEPYPLPPVGIMGRSDWTIRE
jgi:gluconate 2-dehydrogenase gamma chain